MGCDGGVVGILRSKTAMRKCCSDKQLGLRYGLSVRRGAFSLAELIISIGILVLMMSLAGQVFNITVQSTGQATALTEIMQQLRAFEQTLRDDLRGVQPGHSLILIQGNPVNAYWTQNGKDADDDAATAGAGPATGYPHPSDPEREDANANPVKPRADILMIFTTRPASSFVETGTPPLTSNLQQVVYGHAELGEYIPSGTDNPKYSFERATGAQPYFPEANDYPSPTAVSLVPAAQWHLARRSLLLLPMPPPSTGLSWNDINDASPADLANTKKILEGEVDVVGDFQHENLVLRPQIDPTTGLPFGEPWFLPAIFGDVAGPYKDWIKPFARSRLDTTPPALYANRIGAYLLPNCASFKVEWTLNPRSEFVAGRLDRTNEIFWFDPTDDGDPAGGGAYADCRDYFADKPDPLRSLARALCDVRKRNGGVCPTDPKKPDYALCRNLESLLGTRDEHRTYHPDGRRYHLSDRFRGRALVTDDPDAPWDQLAPDKERPNLVVFTATRPAALPPPPPPGVSPPPLNEPVLDPMFTGALRITVDI